MPSSAVARGALPLSLDSCTATTSQGCRGLQARWRAGELPPVLAGTGVELGFRCVEEVPSALPQEEPQVQRSRDRADDVGRVQQVHTSSLEAQLTRTREMTERQLAVRRGDAPFGVMHPELVARPP